MVVYLTIQSRYDGAVAARKRLVRSLTQVDHRVPSVRDDDIVRYVGRVGEMSIPLARRGNRPRGRGKLNRACPAMHDERSLVIGPPLTHAVEE